MDEYYWDIEFTVKMQHVRPPKTVSDDLKRSMMQTHINAKAYNWINNKENLKMLLNLIFKDDVSYLDSTIKQARENNNA